MSISVAESEDQIRACYPVMRQLRPRFGPDAFLERVRFQQRLGYHLVSLEASGVPVAVAGYQIRETLIDGRFLHVDDLVTLDSERSRGYGSQLLRWLGQRAKELGCNSLQLDSGVQRGEAHRFYDREGLRRTAVHFELSLSHPHASAAP